MSGKLGVIKHKNDLCSTCGEQLLNCEIQFGRCCLCGNVWEPKMVPIDIKKNIDYQKAFKEIKEMVKPGKYTMRKRLMYISGIVAKYDNLPGN